VNVIGDPAPLGEKLTLLTNRLIVATVPAPLSSIEPEALAGAEREKSALVWHSAEPVGQP
jgi:hypothetical protein